MVTAEDFRHSEISDPNMSIVRHQNVLQSDVSVGNAMLMQVIDAPQYLLEDAVPVLSDMSLARSCLIQSSEWCKIKHTDRVELGSRTPSKKSNFFSSSKVLSLAHYHSA